MIIDSNKILDTISKIVNIRKVYQTQNKEGTYNEDDTR